MKASKRTSRQDPKKVALYQRALVLYEARRNRQHLFGPDLRCSDISASGVYFVLRCWTGEHLRSYVIGADGELRRPRVPVVQCDDCGAPYELYDISEESESCEPCMVESGDERGVANRHCWREANWDGWSQLKALQDSEAQGATVPPPSSSA